jgi:hypothetical protein
VCIATSTTTNKGEKREEMDKDEEKYLQRKLAIKMFGSGKNLEQRRSRAK